MTDSTSAQVELANAEAAMASVIAGAFTDHQPGTPQTASSPVVPEAPPTPATEQTAQPAGTPEPVAQPEGNKPEGQTTALPDLSTLPAELKKALELYGGDPQRAAEGFLATNTRNAQMAAKLREAGIDPKTLQPYPKPVEPEIPAELPDTRVIQEQVQNVLSRDANYQQVVQQYFNAENEFKQIDNDLASIRDRRMELETYLKHPVIKADSFTAEEYKSELQQLALRELTLKTSSLNLKSELRDYRDQARSMARTAEQVVKDHFQSRIEEQQDAVRDAAIQAEAEAEWETAFPVALDQSMAKHNIPAELKEKLASDVRAYGLMHEGPINDIHGFVSAVAGNLAKQLDTFHRIQAKTYANQAIQRSQQPVSAAPTVANAYASPSNYTNLADHEASLARQLGEAMRGA